MLDALYYGRTSPWERLRERTHAFKEISNQIVAIEQHFRNLLSPEEFKKFEELQGLWGQAEAIESANLFGYAFSTGALMMIDVLIMREMIDQTRKQITRKERIAKRRSSLSPFRLSGLSLKSHDPSQRANGMLAVAGGIVITFTKELPILITGG